MRLDVVAADGRSKVLTRCSYPSQLTCRLLGVIGRTASTCGPAGRTSVGPFCILVRLRSLGDKGLVTISCPRSILFPSTLIPWRNVQAYRVLLPSEFGLALRSGA